MDQLLVRVNITLTSRRAGVDFARIRNTLVAIQTKQTYSLYFLNLISCGERKLTLIKAESPHVQKVSSKLHLQVVPGKTDERN